MRVGGVGPTLWVLCVQHQPSHFVSFVVLFWCFVYKQYGLLCWASSFYICVLCISVFTKVCCTDCTVHAVHVCGTQCVLSKQFLRHRPLHREAPHRPWRRERASFSQHLGNRSFNHYMNMWKIICIHFLSLWGRVLGTRIYGHAWQTNSSLKYWGPLKYWRQMLNGFYKPPPSSVHVGMTAFKA